ncbi:MAG: FAD-dependent oxidoreductase, partial [Clostridium sp.]|nr:FAD-dependent oxidoreductase [Clostridium sp.]
VNGVDNLFCAGEKAGLFVGHTEAICTGSLAGHNAVRYGTGRKLLILPNETVIGDIIDFSNKRFLEENDKKSRFTFAGSVYFNRMKELGLYTIDKNQIKEKINSLGLSNVFREKII